MIASPRFCQIQDLHAHQGRTASPIAHALARAPRTVADWRRPERFQPRKSTPRASTLAPFQPQLVQRLDQSPSSAAQGLQRLRAQGWAGGYSLVNASVRTVRPKRQPALLTLAFAPGEGAQVDWGSLGAGPVGQTRRRLRVFGMVLGYRRMLDVECTVSQTMEHFLACPHHALECFGGIPQKVMVDNLTSAVLTRVLGEAPGFHPTSRDLALHCGFPMAPCHVGQGHEKGRVENGVG